MYWKYRLEENGVLCTDIHSTRAWILVGYRSGYTSIIDYETQDKWLDLKTHAGPVRSISFHPTLSLFLTGSDDSTVKVWNYETRRCTVVFKGHLDYVRKVIFHKVYPWVISCSDDSTIRFWNWMSRESLCTVTGHIHWVTDIDIHYERDILISCSVDNTVRVWDFSSLRNRTAKRGEFSTLTHLFGDMDVVCSYIYEGFSSGVQWVKIHQTLPFLCAADGKVVRVYNTETSREVRTLVGHFGNISSGVFCSGFEDTETLSLVTVSADKTLKVWSLRTGITLDTFPLNTQPASLVAAPSSNLMGLVHGTGLALIKLYKHRPVYTVYKHHLYFIRDSWLTHVNTERKKETRLFKILEVRNQRVQSVSYNQGEHAVLVNYTRFNISSFQLYFIQETTPRQNSKNSAVPSIKSSPGDSALWVSNSRFSHIDNTGRVVVKNLKNQDVNFAGFSRGFLVNKSARTEMNIPKCDKMFQGYVDQEVVLRDTGYLVLYSLNQRRRLANINLGLEVPKQVIWNQDGTKVAILTSKCVRVCDKQLKELSRFRVRQGKIKSGAWCSISAAFIFNTNHQIRYLLGPSDDGLICTAPSGMYITHVQDKQIAYLNRLCEINFIEINPIEYQFKSAVLRGNEDDIRSLATSGKLLGESILGWLQECGRSDIAVHFVQDPAARFSIALELYNPQLAYTSALRLDTPLHWDKVGEMALMVGDLSLAETAYQKGRNYGKLKFLYLITGAYSKLVKLGRILGVRKDRSAQFEVALLLGDIEGQEKLLREGGNKELGELLLKTFHLENKNEEDLSWETFYSDSDVHEQNTNSKSGVYLQGAVPILGDFTNWPLVPIPLVQS